MKYKAESAKSRGGPKLRWVILELQDIRLSLGIGSHGRRAQSTVNHENDGNDDGIIYALKN